jgi:hypothetical protein
VIVTATALFGPIGSGGPPASPNAAEQDVDLRTGGAPARGLTGEEAARALAPFAADRLRCRPLGCESWWHAGGVAQVSPARVGDHLVVAFDDRLTALDTTSGLVRWAAPLETVQPDPATGWQLRAAELVLAADQDDLLVWAPRGFVQVRDQDGAVRWSITLPETRRLWGATLTDATVVVASAANSADGPIEVVMGFDRRHGTVRWRQRVRWTYGTGPDGALVRTSDDRVALLDPASGRPAFHLDVDQPRWVSARGAFFVARGDGQTIVLLDRGSGEVVLTGRDVADVADLRDGTGSVALLVVGRHEPEDGASTRLVAIGPDGTTRWERPVGCCPTLVSSPAGTVAVRTEGGEPPLVLSAADGATLVIPTRGGGELRWLSDDLLVTTQGDTPVLIGVHGDRIALDGAHARVVSVDPLIVASREGLLAIDRSAASPAVTPSPKVDAEREARARAAPSRERDRLAAQAPGIRRR